MTDHALPEAWRRGFYETIAQRRDMRSFLPDPSSAETLARTLLAAHQAGMVKRLEAVVREYSNYEPLCRLTGQCAFSPG